MTNSYKYTFSSGIRKITVIALSEKHAKWLLENIYEITAWTDPSWNWKIESVLNLPAKRRVSELDKSRLVDLELDGVDTRDYPDFCDAFICGGCYEEPDGTIRDLTEDEIEALNEDSSFLNELAHEKFQ